jgi:hypothetical protein
MVAHIDVKLSNDFRCRPWWYSLNSQYNSCNYTRKNLTACQQDVRWHCLFVVWNELIPCITKVHQANRLATSCTKMSDIIITSCWWQQARSNLLRTTCISLVVASLLPLSTLYNKVITTCSRLVNEQLRTSSANTSWYRLDNNIVTTCLQSCNNLRVFQTWKYTKGSHLKTYQQGYKL